MSDSPLFSDVSFASCRYLESCSGPAMKRKSESLSIAASSSSTTSEEDKTAAAPPEDRTNAEGKELYV